LLLLSSHETRQIVEAFRALARVRSWTLTAVTVGYGLSIVLLAALHNIAAWLITGVQQLFLSWVRDNLLEYAPIWIILIFAVVAIPLIKGRLVIALTLAIVTRFNGAARALMRTLLLLLLFGVQGGIIWYLGWYNYNAEWGSVLGGVFLALLAGWVLEQGALALTLRFIWREGVRHNATL
jgi:hypothetical protein